MEEVPSRSGSASSDAGAAVCWESERCVCGGSTLLALLCCTAPCKRGNRLAGKKVTAPRHGLLPADSTAGQLPSSHWGRWAWHTGSWLCPCMEEGALRAPSQWQELAKDEQPSHLQPVCGPIHKRFRLVWRLMFQMVRPFQSWAGHRVRVSSRLSLLLCRMLLLLLLCQPRGPRGSYCVWEGMRPVPQGLSPVSSWTILGNIFAPLNPLGVLCSFLLFCIPLGTKPFLSVPFWLCKWSEPHCHPRYLHPRTGKRACQSWAPESSPLPLSCLPETEGTI